MQLQFLAPVELFFKQLKGYSFLIRAESIFFIYAVFSAVWSVMSTFFVKTDKFNHFGRSDACNSTHHGRYVFQTAFFS